MNIFFCLGLGKRFYSFSFRALIFKGDYLFVSFYVLFVNFMSYVNF